MNEKEYVDSLILGSCLGDAGITKASGRCKSYIDFCQCLSKEKDYAIHKKDLISKYYKTNSLIESNKKNTIRFSISSTEREIITKIEDFTRYKEDNSRKLLTDHLDSINEVVLLYWYLDDGSLAISEQKRHNRKGSVNRKLRIALSSFKDDEILKLIEYINSKFELSFRPFVEKGKIVSIGINNNIKEISKFLSLIYPYKDMLPKCMHYKFCLCYAPTLQTKDVLFENYNICNFHSIWCYNEPPACMGYFRYL